MTYEQLADLWKIQRQQYQEWEFRLLQSPELLRDAVANVLVPPHEIWEEHGTGRRYRYVDVVDFYQQPKPERKRLTNKSIRTDGHLVFGIGITFDHGLTAYPKNDIYMPVAARFTISGAEFALFNKSDDSVEQHWSIAADFALKLVDRYREYLSHDPHTGFGAKKRMGFL